MPNPDALLMLLSRHCDGLGVGRQARFELMKVELSSTAADEVSLFQLAQSKVKFTCKTKFKNMYFLLVSDGFCSFKFTAT